MKVNFLKWMEWNRNSLLFCVDSNPLYMLENKGNEVSKRV